MMLSNNPESSVALTQLLVIFLLGSSHLVWTNPSLVPFERVSGVQQGEQKFVLTTDSNSLPKSFCTEDEIKMTQKAQSDPDGLQKSFERSNNLQHGTSVGTDSFAADGTGAAAEPKARERRRDRWGSYLGGLKSKLLFNLGKKAELTPAEALKAYESQIEAHLLEENQLKDYIRRHHGIGEGTEEALVDQIGLEGPKWELSLEELYGKETKLRHEREKREERWSKISSGPSEADLGGLSRIDDSQKRKRAIEVETAALREDISLMESIVTKNVPEANQRLRILEALHALAELYRAAIESPSMAIIELNDDPAYKEMINKFWNMWANLLVSYDEYKGWTKRGKKWMGLF